MAKNKTLRDRASDLVETLAPHVENARDRAVPVLHDARDRAVPLLADARDRAVPVLHDARDRAVPLLADARDKATPYLTDARDKATPYLADARDKATPYLADARDKATPYLSDARDKAAPFVADARDRFASDVLPAVTAAAAAVDEATEDVRAEALKRGRAVAAALRGEVPAPVERSHKLRNLLVALGLGGVGYAAYKKLVAKPASNWQSSYTPPPAADVPTTVDTAAADPAEAAADATEVPHTATTPDNPVIEIDVDRR